jgi:DNA-binding CsgD family transcriptional regulator
MGAFGLTMAEARLARVLVAGHTLDDYAASVDVSHNTARNQLASILAKTGAKRQAELVATILAVFALAIFGGQA